ncbi:MAG: transposase, partial [Gammaproteobacteria bacterium]|nr:transposase [Gammaproteobacteria bacterium]
RLSEREDGKISYELKTPYRNGTTHVLFEPLDFISRLASLVPKPRVHLTRFHGVFAPNSKYRSLITAEAPGHKEKPKVTELQPEKTRSSMNWSERLKRVFNIDISLCPHCQGTMKIIACIEEREAIDKILAHINKQNSSGKTPSSVSSIRAPPRDERLFH